MANPVIIEDYDPCWPQLFQGLRAQLAAALGELAVTIEHVGSTAVFGLAAKPIIDIDVLLRSSATFPVVTRRLAEQGYEYQGDLGVCGRDVFRAKAGAVRHHLHVCPPGSNEFARHIAFRDHLRAHAEDANSYADLKREIAGRFPNDRKAYTEAKGELIRRILGVIKDA